MGPKKSQSGKDWTNPGWKIWKRKGHTMIIWNGRRHGRKMEKDNNRTCSYRWWLQENFAGYMKRKGDEKEGRISQEES